MSPHMRGVESSRDIDALCERYLSRALPRATRPKPMISAERYLELISTIGRESMNSRLMCLFDLDFRLTDWHD
jgi:hypothetical protein